MPEINVGDKVVCVDKIFDGRILIDKIYIVESIKSYYFWGKYLKFKNVDGEWHISNFKLKD